MREKLPNRRMAITERLIFREHGKAPVEFDVTYGFEPGGPVKECFTLAFHLGSSLQHLMHKGCMSSSVALQSGQSMADMARVFGDLDTIDPPKDMFSVVVRRGVELDVELIGVWALVRAYEIPKPTTEAAAADEMEHIDLDSGRRRAFHIVGAEVGQKCAAAEPPQRAGVGLNGSPPPAHYDTGDNVSEMFPEPVFELLTSSQDNAAFLKFREYVEGEVIAAIEGQRPVPEDTDILGAMREIQDAITPLTSRPQLLNGSSVIPEIPDFLRRTTAPPTDGAAP